MTDLPQICIEDFGLKALNLVVWLGKSKFGVHSAGKGGCKLVYNKASIGILMKTYKGLEMISKLPMLAQQSINSNWRTNL